MMLLVRTLFAQWQRVSEVQSITLLYVFVRLNVCCNTTDGLPLYRGSPQVIIVRGQLLPLRAATLHWLRWQQQHQQLMRESSPMATEHRLYAPLSGTQCSMSYSACLRLTDEATMTISVQGSCPAL